jgi:ATP-dependent Clp protease ATP-binding subunit ClpA
VDVFKPELLNRFSKIIVFRDLKLKETEEVVKLNLAVLAATVKEQGIELEFSPEAISRVAKLGYDPAFGARPIRRVIDERVRAQLAQLLLKQEVHRGQKVLLALRGEEFVFELQQ